MHDAGIRGRRVAIIAVCRTPLCRSGSVLKDVSAVELAQHATIELLMRSGLNEKDVDEMFFGQVVSSVQVPNLAQEVSLLPQFPASIPASSVNRACASANSAISMGADQIAQGHADVVIAGGSESLSDIPELHSRRFADTPVALSRARSLGERLKLISRVRPRDLVPVTPAIAEPSTGESMGESAEKMAKLNGITRQVQDEFAPVFTQAGAVDRDNAVRPDTSLDKMAKLKPVFDRRHGSVTAANASPLTDGGSAVLLIAEEAARTLGYQAQILIRVNGQLSH